MPRLSIFFIRFALVHFALGFTLGALMLANKGLNLHPWLWRLLPLHIELLLVGWTLQFAMGVAFWILPRFRALRGNIPAAWLAFGLLNAGVWLAMAGFLLPAASWLILVGRLAQVAAAGAFAVHAWPRIKPLGV